MNDEPILNDDPDQTEDADKSSAGPTDAPGGDEKLRAELDKAKRDYLYLAADFDNYRKNAIKERSDLTKYGSERFVRDFLKIYDNFERALESGVTATANDAFVKGVALIATELKNLLQKFGVEELPADGVAFDPAKHEALSSEPRADIPAGHVARVFQKAYKMHDKLLRPAQVVVASSPTSAE